MAVLLGSFVFVVGSWLRVTFSYSPFLALAGQTIASCSNPIFLNAPTKVAAVWFKPDSRNLATNIAAVSNIIGNALGAFIPPWIVQGGDQYRTSQVTLLMIVEASFLTFVFIVSIFFFRKEPREPPSAAAAAPRESTGKSLICDFNFILLSLSFMCANGTVNGVSSVLLESFRRYSYSDPEDLTSLVSFLLFIVGFIGSLFFSYAAGKTKKLKLLLIIANLFSALSLVALIFIIPLQNKWISGLCCCAFGLFNISTIPLTL